MLLSLRITLRQLERKEDSLDRKRSNCPFAQYCISCIQSYTCQSKHKSQTTKGIELLSLDNGDILVGEHRYTWEEWVSLCKEILGEKNYWKLNKVKISLPRIYEKFANGKEYLAMLKLPFDEYVKEILKRQSNPLEIITLKGDSKEKIKVHQCDGKVTWGLKKLIYIKNSILTNKYYQNWWGYKANNGRPPPVILR